MKLAERLTIYDEELGSYILRKDILITKWDVINKLGLLEEENISLYEQLENLRNALTKKNGE